MLTYLLNDDSVVVSLSDTFPAIHRECVKANAQVVHGLFIAGKRNYLLSLCNALHIGFI